MIRLSQMVKGSGKAVAQDAAPKKQQTLQEHLKQYHGGKMPKGKCKFLKQYEQEHPEEFKAAEAEVAIENADKNKKVIPNTQRFAKPEDYDKANAEGITAIKDWINGDDKSVGDITQAYTRSEYPNGETWEDVAEEWDEFVGNCPEIEDEDKVEEAAKELDKRLRMWNKAKMFNGAFNGIKTNIDDAEDDAIVRELGTRADLLDALKKNGLNRKEAQYAFLLGQVEDIANAAADNNLLYKEDGSIDMGLFANDRILDMSEDEMKAEFKNAETNADKWFGKETSNGEGDNGSGKEGEEERIKNLSDEDLANEIARERANLRHPSLASSRSTIKENVARLEQEQKNRAKNGGKKDEKNDANADGNKNANANGGASADPLDAVQSAIWSELSKRDEIKDMDCDVLGDGKLTLGFKMIRGGQFGESAKALLGNALKKMGLSAENIENVSDDGKGSATVTVNTNGKSSQDLKDAIEGKPSDVKKSAEKWMKHIDNAYGVDTQGALSRIEDLDGCIAQATERVKKCDDKTLGEVASMLQGDFMTEYDRPFKRLTTCLKYPGVAAGLGYQDKKTIEKELNDLEDNYVQTYLSAMVAKSELDSRKAK